MFRDNVPVCGKIYYITSGPRARTQTHRHTKLKEASRPPQALYGPSAVKPRMRCAQPETDCLLPAEVGGAGGVSDRGSPRGEGRRAAGGQNSGALTGRALGAGWGRDWTEVAAGEGVKVGVGPGEREGRREGAGEEGWGGSGEGEEEEREQGGEEKMERVL